jgi:hypothetical protein
MQTRQQLEHPTRSSDPIDAADLAEADALEAEAAATCCRARAIRARVAARSAASATVHADSPQLVAKGVAAAALSVSVSTLDRLCRAGVIPFVYAGEVRKFDLVAVRAALDAYTAARRTKPPAHGAAREETPGVRFLSRRGTRAEPKARG